MKEKQCKDCIYYVQHYTKDNTRYYTVFCGHCTNKRPSGHYRKTDKICESYVKKNLKQEKRKQIKSAAEYLSFIIGTNNRIDGSFKRIRPLFTCHFKRFLIECVR